MEGEAEFTNTAVTVYGAGNNPDDYLAAFPPVNPTINVEGPSVAAFPPPVIVLPYFQPSTDDYPVAPVNPTVNVEGPSMAAFPPPMNAPASFQPSTGNPERKRGRPRKYGPDCSSGPVFSPVPISAIPPPPEEPKPAEKRASKLESETPDDASPFHRGRNCTLHIITVYAGEDVGMKIMKAFSKSRAITVLSAIGSISLVTIRKPDAAEGRVIHEGHFEIVSLNGSFMPMKNGSLMSRCGGLSVYLVDGEDKTIAGALAGMLIAESDVTVTVASFLPSDSNQRKRKRAETEPSSGPGPTMGLPRGKKPKNPNGGQMSPSQAGPSAQHSLCQSSGPAPSMGPPRGKEPMNPTGGLIPDLSPAPSSQAGSSAQHSSSQSSGPAPTMGPPRGKEPMNPNGGLMPDCSPAPPSQAGSSVQPGSSQCSGPGPTMGPPRSNEPMNPNGGGMPNFSPATSSQAGPSAEHGLSQDNRDPWTEDEPPEVMLLEEIDGNCPSWFMKFG